LHFTVLVFPLVGTSGTVCTPTEIRDQHLKDRIGAAIETVAPEMLSYVWEEAEYRLDIRSMTDGTHIFIIQLM
jgi:hypothetical protein